MVGGDANTWIGRRLDGTEAMAEVVGNFQRGKRTRAGDLSLDSVETLGSMALASFVGGGPAYCGTQGSTSSIDDFLSTKGSEETAGKSERVLETGASVAAGAVSIGAGPHAIADGASLHLRSQKWSTDRENCVEF